MSIMVKYDFGVWNDNRFIGFWCNIKVKVGDMFYKEFYVVSGYLKVLRII